MNEPRYGWAKNGYRYPIRWLITNSHHRKFMMRKGEYLDGDKIINVDLYFWGEYEAHSDCEIKDLNSTPQAVHDVLHPVRGTTPLLTNAKNTDPYVFGNHFKNICCGIPKEKKEKENKKEYKKGDVVLFGYKEDDFFYFDTVFVVDKKVDIDYSRTTTQYYKASIEPYNMDRKEPVKYYYQGVSYSENKECFSFVPCSLDYTTKNLPCVNYKDFMAHREINQKRWKIILEAVKKAGWHRGIYFDKI